MGHAERFQTPTATFLLFDIVIELALNIKVFEVLKREPIFCRFEKYNNGSLAHNTFEIRIKYVENQEWKGERFYQVMLR